ncbi:MAG: glycoside hydrolase family 97 protein, partial [Armatimonadota bacterium]
MTAILGISASYGMAIASPDIVLQSPNGQISVRLRTSSPNSIEDPTWSANFNGQPILTACKMGINVEGHGNLLAGAQFVGEQRNRRNNRIRLFFGKADFAQDHFQEIRLELRSPDKSSIFATLRCYDDAIALRYEIPGKGKITIGDEGTSFHLSGNPSGYVQYLENYNSSHEHSVTNSRLDEIKPDTLIDMPATFAYPDGTHVAITQAGLRHYAGMSLMRNASDTSLICRLTPRSDGNKVVGEGSITTPWRVVLIGNRGGALLESNTLYCLNAPNEIGSTDWIKPGKMTWPWWNGNVVDNGKDEPPIFSLEAQRKYIDFCAANGIPYHSTIADNTTTPWYFQTNQGVSPGPDTDVTRVRPDLDLEGIRKYADSKGVRLWTWVHQAALRGRVEEAFAAFEKMGWKGMMVDFFDHDDQGSVEHAEAILKSAAKHHILIHFHGIWPPTGLQRTYPNLVNHEASLNLEVNKWATRVTPEHTMNLVFTRMLAGPMDYHAGGFRAVNPEHFQAHFVAPNVLGSRCNMLASYVCFDNPNPMVADHPDAYINQPGFDFLKMVPTWWDETRILSGVIGREIITARRKGKTWYIGCMTAVDGLDTKISLKAFLPRGKYTARIWRDSLETVQDPNHLITESVTLSS